MQAARISTSTIAVVMILAMMVLPLPPFALDLLFFHRGLNALVAIELKVGRFEPEYLGKLNFYLEALDRDQKKAPRKPGHRPAALRQQGRRSRRIRSQPLTHARAGRAIPDPVAGQETAASQAARVLCGE